MSTDATGANLYCIPQDEVDRIERLLNDISGNLETFDSISFILGNTIQVSSSCIGRHLEVNTIDNYVERVAVISTSLCKFENILTISVIEPKEINSIVRKLDRFPILVSCRKIFKKYCEKESELFPTPIVLYSHDLTGWKQYFELKRAKSRE